MNINERNLAMKSVLKTQGWKYIKYLFEEKINNLRLPKNINKNKGYNDIAIEVLGKAYAVRVLERLIKELDKIENEKPIEKNRPMI